MEGFRRRACCPVATPRPFARRPGLARGLWRPRGRGFCWGLRTGCSRTFLLRAWRRCWRLSVRRELVTRLYGEKFGGTPELWARAPGRVDLMGSHTDYNLGFVLTLPISRDTWVAARARDDGRIRLYSANLDAEDCFDLGSLEPRGKRVVWSDYVRGVAWALAGAGFSLRGFDAVIDSTVPIGSGLSSSAALECASAVVFRALGGWEIQPEQMAQLRLKAENEYIGLNC